MSDEFDKRDPLNLMKEVISDKEARDFLLDICEFGKKVKEDDEAASDRPKIFLLCDVQIDNYNAVCPDKSHEDCHKKKEKCHEDCKKPCDDSNPPCGGRKALLESIRCSELDISNVQRFLLGSIIIHDLNNNTCLYVAKPTKEDLYPLMYSRSANLVLIAL